MAHVICIPQCNAMSQCNVTHLIQDTIWYQFRRIQIQTLDNCHSCPGLTRVTAPILSQSTTNHQNNSNITTVVRRPHAGQHLSVTQHISVTRYMRHTSHGSNGVCIVHSVWCVEWRRRRLDLDSDIGDWSSGCHQDVLDEECLVKTNKLFIVKKHRYTIHIQS